MTTFTIHENHQVCFEVEGRGDNLCFNCALGEAVLGKRIFTHVEISDDAIICDKCNNEI